MYIPLCNGLRFFAVDGSLNSIETDFERERYGLQYVHGHFLYPFTQPVDFTDFSRVQVITPTNATVTIQIFNANGTQIFTDTFAYVGNALQDANLRVYNYTINWNSVNNKRDCLYIVITQGSIRFRSEPIRNGRPGELLKLVYSNFYDHRQIGSYLNCFEMIAYVPGRLIRPEQPRELAFHTDSQLRDVYLAESHFRTRVLQVYESPQYMHLITQYALRHDKVQIFQKGTSKTYSAQYQWLEQYTSNHIDYSTVYAAETVLKKVPDRLRSVTSAGESTYSPTITILPVTNVTATSFQANWSGTGTSYDVQLSTSPTFATTVISTNTVNQFFNFTGLSSCVRYYYRVRAVSCEGVGAWSTGTTTEQVSFHFRGEQNFGVWEWDEKVSSLTFFNIFANLQGVAFKFAPTTGVINWNIYPFRTLLQVEQDVQQNTSANFSVYVQVDGYAQGSEGLGVLQYIVPSVRLSVDCLTYNFRGSTQDQYIAFRRKTSWQSVTVASSAANLWYAFIPDLNALRQETIYNISSLSTLNTLINSHAGTDYAVAIFAAYTGTNTTATITINLQYI